MSNCNVIIDIEFVSEISNQYTIDYQRKVFAHYEKPTGKRHIINFYNQYLVYNIIFVYFAIYNDTQMIFKQFNITK